MSFFDGYIEENDLLLRPQSPTQTEYESEMDVDINSFPLVLAPDPSLQCAICNDEFASGSATDNPVRELPCRHMYHSMCILPWLCRSNSCPLCCCPPLPLDTSAEQEPPEVVTWSDDVLYDGRNTFTFQDIYWHIVEMDAEATELEMQSTELETQSLSLPITIGEEVSEVDALFCDFDIVIEDELQGTERGTVGTVVEAAELESTPIPIMSGENSDVVEAAFHVEEDSPTLLCSM